jgi:uncharacterized FAD-dependent dehydrogenase
LQRLIACKESDLMNNVFDIGIIGAGVAGAFAILRLSKEHKNVKTVIFDLGRPPMKRRRQLEGWLGVLPNSDGKLYLSDKDKVAALVGNRKINSSTKWINNIFGEVSNFKTIKDKSPNVSIEKKLKKSDFHLQLNNYVQLYPKEIHSLSKFISDVIEENKNITCCFDNEVIKITKQKSLFIIQTDLQEYKCKKIILCTGRSGWRWASELYSNFGIIEDNSMAKFGVRMELPATSMKDFNKSNCSIFKNDGSLEIGPFSWFGTVIPEDHVDLAISSFRSNENRWKSDKVSFNFIGNLLTEDLPPSFTKDQGYQQTDRIGKLIFVLSNDRILKEKVSTILNEKSKGLIIPEYEWIKKSIEGFSEIIPDIATKAYFHIPTIIPLPPRINIGNNLETEVDGMFVAGENAGIVGLYAAAAMGTIAADSACK